MITAQKNIFAGPDSGQAMDGLSGYSISWSAAIGKVWPPLIDSGLSYVTTLAVLGTFYAVCMRERYIWSYPTPR